MRRNPPRRTDQPKKRTFVKAGSLWTWCKKTCLLAGGPGYPLLISHVLGSKRPHQTSVMVADKFNEEPFLHLLRMIAPVEISISNVINICPPAGLTDLGLFTREHVHQAFLGSLIDVGLGA